MSLVYVETDQGESLKVTLEGMSPGSAVMSFVTFGLIYCTRRTEAKYKTENEWFQHLTRHRNSFCDELRILEATLYSGEFYNYREGREYTEEEYSIFLERTGMAISEEKFQEELRDIKRHWQPIELVNKAIDNLIKDFDSLEDKSIYFYDPSYTPNVFGQLSITLKQALERDSKFVRLRIIVS